MYLSMTVSVKKLIHMRMGVPGIMEAGTPILITAADNYRLNKDSMSKEILDLNNYISGRERF